MTVFDSNAILRYILQDNEEMADSVEKQIESGECYIPTEVAAETVYVLSKVYKIPRQEISAAVIGFLAMDNVSSADTDVLAKGPEVYASSKFDFVDSLMIGYQSVGYSVFTFDKDLSKALKAAEKRRKIE